MTNASTIVVSNRGGVSFSLDEAGQLRVGRGGGGLAAGLAGVVESGDTVWISAAMSEADREACRQGLDRANGAAFIDVEPDRYANYYDRISNETLWFVHHHLFDGSSEPSFDAKWFDAFDDFRRVNQQFADVICNSAGPEAIVLVQDYHLSLLPAMLKAQRDDLRVVHFHHTPFGEAPITSMLPDAPRRELLESLAAADACGFHSQRWVDAFTSSCEASDVAPPSTFVAPLPIDPASLLDSASSPRVAAERERLMAVAGGRALLVRVDRLELSKNLIRGFSAFDEMLELHEQWRGNVVFGAFCYPSRPNVAAYQHYRELVEAEVARVNQRWQTASWTPIVFETDDNYPRSLAALGCADAVLVNPIRDGLNLVAKEAALLNDHDAQVVLSTEAGVFDELANVVRRVNPFNVSDTAEALHEVLSMEPSERQRAAQRLRDAATLRQPSDWLDDQLRALESTRS